MNVYSAATSEPTPGPLDSVLFPEQNLTAALLQSTPNADEPEIDEEVEKMEFYCTLFILMAFFFVMAGVIERYKPKCGH